MELTEEEDAKIPNKFVQDLLNILREALKYAYMTRYIAAFLLQGHHAYSVCVNKIDGVSFIHEFN